MLSDGFIELVDTELRVQGMQLKDLAEKAGVTPQTICMIRSRGTVPTMRVFEQVLDALGYDIEIKKRDRDDSK